MTATLAAVVAAAAPYTAEATTAPSKLTTRIAEQQLATWRCQDQLGRPRTRASVSPWALPRPTAYRRWVLWLWTQRAGVCRAAQHELERQWNWREFTTPMERAVAMCETGINWSHRTSDYEGAYGFYRGSWDAFKPAGYPDAASDATPWQQTVVMRRIRDRYGWSGWGCVTHGGYLHWLGRV